MEPPPPPPTAIEQDLKRIQNHRGVEGILLLNKSGEVLKTSLRGDVQAALMEHVPGIALLANNVVRELKPANELKFLRMVTPRREIIIAPSKDFTLITVQKSLE